MILTAADDPQLRRELLHRTNEFASAELPGEKASEGDDSQKGRGARQLHGSFESV